MWLVAAGFGVAMGAITVSVRRVATLAAAVRTLGVSPQEIDPPFLRATSEVGGAIDRDIARARAADDEGELAIALIDADAVIEAYPRLPRILASVSSSGSLVLAAAALRTALRDVGELGWIAVGDALGIAALGVFGLVFCVSLQREYARLRADARTATNRLAGL